MWKYMAALLALLVAPPAHAKCSLALMFSKHVGLGAKIHQAKDPRVYEAYEYVLVRAGMKKGPMICTYSQGVHLLMHVIFIDTRNEGFPTLILVPEGLTNALSRDHLAYGLAHELGHVVRGRAGLMRRNGYTTEEIAVDMLVADWLGTRKALDGLRAIQVLVRKEVAPVTGNVFFNAAFEADMMRRVVALQERLRVESCDAEFTVESRVCRGGEGRDNDECYMRIKYRYQACLNPRQHTASQ